MAGHSKWANIKYRKELVDKRKSKIFSKLAKMISIAARNGKDPETNPTLRLAIEKARSVNMPNSNIEKAIKRGTGETKEGQLEEIVYEGYGPEGIQLLIEAITDNKNRTTSEIRHLLSKYNGRLAESGSVKWNFNQMGVISVALDKQEKNKEELELIAIDSGAEDVKWKNSILEIYIKPENLEKAKQFLQEKNIAIEDSSLDWVPKSEIELKDESIKKQLEGLFEALDENDDVKEIYSNVKL